MQSPEEPVSPVSALVRPIERQSKFCQPTKEQYVLQRLPSASSLTGSPGRHTRRHTAPPRCPARWTGCTGRSRPSSWAPCHSALHLAGYLHMWNCSPGCLEQSPRHQSLVCEATWGRDVSLHCKDGIRDTWCLRRVVSGLQANTPGSTGIWWIQLAQAQEGSATVHWKCCEPCMGWQGPSHCTPGREEEVPRGLEGEEASGK